MEYYRKRDNYPVKSDGSVHLTLEGVSLHFENIEEGIDYLEKSILSLLKKSTVFFKNLPEPKPSSQNLLNILDSLYAGFQESSDFELKVENHKNLFFEALKEIEIMKRHYRKKGENFKTIDAAVKLRNQLLLLFVQAERLIYIESENRFIIQKIKDNLKLCEAQLATYLSGFPDSEIEGLLPSFEINRKIVYCLDYFKKAHRINPYKDNLERAEEILIFINDLEKDNDSHEIYEKIKEARLLLDSENLASFAP